MPRINDKKKVLRTCDSVSKRAYLAACKRLIRKNRVVGLDSEYHGGGNTKAAGGRRGEQKKKHPKKKNPVGLKKLDNEGEGGRSGKERLGGGDLKTKSLQMLDE